MKKQDLFKFSLTAICVAVLSACGSSGGGSLAVENTPTTPSANANANTGAANSAELAAAQKAAQEAAAQKAAADKAAAEAAAKQAEAEKAAAAAKTAAEKAAAEKAAAEAKAAAEKAAAEKAAKEAAAKAKEDTAKAVEKALKDKEAADKKAAEDKAKADEEAKAKALADKAAADKVNAANALGSKDRLTAEPDLSTTTSFVGYKHVVKNNSNLITNETRGTDSKSSTPTPMRVQKPHASLDTIVVAEPVQEGSGAPRVYLEDFDTRTTTNAVAVFGEINKKARGTNGADATPAQITEKGSVGNTSLQHIYINSNTKNINGDPAIEKQRTALAKSLSDLNAQVTKVQGTITAKTSELGLLETAAAAAKGDVASAATPALKQAAQAKADVLSTKVNALATDIEKLKQEKQILDEKVIAATVEQAKFDALNPIPAPQASISDERSNSEGLGYETKTKTMGTKAGGIWTFSSADIKNKHQNFTEYSEATNSTNTVKRGFTYVGKDANGNVLVSSPIDVKPLVAANSGGTITTSPLASRQLDKTVAEIYGVRTKAYGGAVGFTRPFDTMDQPTEAGTPNQPANNLPLVNEYLGDRLKHVQYGRVTSALHGRDVVDSYKEGVVEQNGSINTYVASFGEYGDKGTENHYFYRGLNNVGADELKLLKADTKNGTLVYEGHAVAYGLNNNYRGNIPVPTALGARVGFVSGNHAHAEVNLATNAVTGLIYNKWVDSINSPTNLLDVPLVTFKGVIADNGNIAGTALKTDDQSTGLFGATLYGKGAEIGGTVASDNKDAKKWGAVFGGKLQEKPTTPVLPGVADGTDGKN